MGKSRFQPPFHIGLEIYKLSDAELEEFLRERKKWLREMSAKQGPLKDFSVITPENYMDFIDDDEDEITPEQREALKRDVLAGKVPGYVDEDGTIHLGETR